jgi:hypothetical protein
LFVHMSLSVRRASTLYEDLQSKLFNLETQNFLQTFSKAVTSVLNPKV